MRLRIPAPGAVLSVLVLPFILALSAAAQFSGAAASASSSGFAGHAATGTVPSAVVPVHPPTGTVPLINPLSPGATVPNGRIPSASDDGYRHHHHHDGAYAVPFLYPVPYVIGADSANSGDYADTDSEDGDADYQGGPTVFDRRGEGADSYVPPVHDVPRPHAGLGAEEADDSPQPPTLLIFKDGHSLEIENYAIVGATLFDLTPGHRRKIALAELDLDATRERNQDHGIIFQLPPQAN